MQSADIQYYIKKRIEFIDLIKGLCILMVISIHSGISEPPNFCSLRMPLYFILSGIFFKSYDTKTFLIKKTNNIIIPFLFFFVLSFLWQIFFYKKDLISCLEMIKENPLDFITLINGPLWFLLALYITNIMFYYVLKLNKNILITTCIVVIIASLGYGYYYFDLNYPWIKIFAISSFALSFFFFGYIIKQKSLLFKVSVKYCYIYIALSLLGAYLIYRFFQYPRLLFSLLIFFGNPILIFLNSCLMVISALYTCKLIKWLPIISYIGRHSIILLCIHGPIIIFLQEYLKLGENNITNFIIFFTTILICWLSIPILKKIIPHFIAQKPLLKHEYKRKIANISL